MILECDNYILSKQSYKKFPSATSLSSPHFLIIFLAEIITVVFWFIYNSNSNYMAWSIVNYLQYTA